MLRCADGSLYTGIATDVQKRIAEHETGKRGAKYLRGRGPLQLVFAKQVGNRSLATRIEANLKQLRKVEKEDLQSVALRVDSYIKERATTTQ